MMRYPKIYEALSYALTQSPKQQTGLGWKEVVAEGIAADPQAFLDAMVEDGTLRVSRGGPCWYEVVPPEPPHVHEWHALGVNTRAGTVVLQCTGCTERQSVSAKLPIEIPKVSG